MSVANRLAERSTLTGVQLETLALHRRVLSGEISLRQAADQRKRGPVSVGAYYRVVGQAQKNVRASILTVLTALWLGYVKFEDVSRLLQLVGKGPIELGEEETDQLMMVLNAVLDKIVM
ncbi:MAG: hypothetical protein LYZ66_05590 [Nitrososphaerales archaeon]|nr:hypothetical protein [Nitrososphaerales archaeon]